MSSMPAAMGGTSPLTFVQLHFSNAYVFTPRRYLFSLLLIITTGLQRGLISALLVAMVLEAYRRGAQHWRGGHTPPDDVHTGEDDARGMHTSV